MDDNSHSLQNKLKRVSDAISQFDNSKDKAEHVREEMIQLLATLSRTQEETKAN